MTVLFVRPLLKVSKSLNRDRKQTSLVDVAKRSLVASVVSLLASVANILTAAVFMRERGVICMTCCMVDVAVSLVTIHWIHILPISLHLYYAIRKDQTNVFLPGHRNFFQTEQKEDDKRGIRTENHGRGASASQ